MKDYPKKNIKELLVTKEEREDRMILGMPLVVTRGLSFHMNNREITIYF